MSPEESYRATVRELQALAARAPYVTQDWVLKVASMAPDDMRRRLIRNYDWHCHFAHCLDGIKELGAMPGRAPDGCWDHRSVRRVVEQLLARSGLTWEDDFRGRRKDAGEGGA